MLNPGVYSLGDFPITVPSSVVTTDPVTGLAGMQAATVQMRFAYGSGGATVDAYLQTSIDQGTTWIDIAHHQFGSTSEIAVFNLSGMTPITSPVAPSDGALAGAGVDGILGDMLRIKAVVLGTYAGSTLLSCRAAVR